MKAFLEQYGLYFAWVIALVATGGSLYLSEVRGFVPCQLCWFQRIFMYPLVVVLGLASYRGEARVVAYVLPLSLIGMFLGGYHYLEQKVPWIGSGPFCGVGVPCTAEYVNLLGFITIPLMSLVAFTLITVFLWPLRRVTDDA